MIIIHTVRALFGRQNGRVKTRRFTPFVLSIIATVCPLMICAQSKPPQTETGFYFPVNQKISGDGNWLACGIDYYSGLRHIGIDLVYPIDTPVYAVDSGVVVNRSGPLEKSGWGAGNYALVIKHNSTDGEFLAVYGHIKTDLSIKKTVEAGEQIGTIGPYEESRPHLHFGIFPTGSGFPGSGWGRVKDEKCSNSGQTNGFTAPIKFITTRSPIRSETYDLSGEWVGHGYGAGGAKNTVRIQQTGPEIVARKVTGTSYVPAGEISWHGTFTSNPFRGKMRIARRNYSDARWHDISVRVLNKDTFVITFIRESNSKKQLVYGSIRFERLVSNN